MPQSFSEQMHAPKMTAAVFSAVTAIKAIFSNPQFNPFLVRVTGEMLNLILSNTPAYSELPDHTIYLGQGWAAAPRLLPRAASHYQAIETHALMRSEGVHDRGYSNWCLPGSPIISNVYDGRNSGKLAQALVDFSNDHKQIWMSNLYSPSSPEYAWTHSLEVNNFFDDTDRRSLIDVLPVRQCDHLIMSRRALRAVQNRVKAQGAALIAA